MAQALSRLHVRSTVMTTASPIVLEPAAQQVADAFSKPPFLYEMTPADARKVLEDAQSGPVSKLPVDEEWITVPAQVGDARVRVIKPQGVTGALPVIVYMHGGGWILGNAATQGLDASRMAVAGESVGGDMSAALALMAKERGDVTFAQVSMYYPVT